MENRVLRRAIAVAGAVRAAGGKVVRSGWGINRGALPPPVFRATHRLTGRKVAYDKRDARRRRNALRAKGQHRQAVR